MTSNYQGATAAYQHISARLNAIPSRLDELRQAAELLVCYGWFDHSKLEKYSRHEWFNMMEEAIGEAASMYGVSGTVAALHVLGKKNLWLDEWVTQVPRLLNDYECSTHADYD